jgi:hypothetical protein
MKYDPINFYSWYCYDPERVRKRLRFKPSYYYRKTTGKK